MPRQQFVWIENPEKEIADSTRLLYQRRLNALAKQGYSTRDDLLNHATEVNNFIEENGSRQMKNLYYGAVFYILGRQDFTADPRAVPLFNGFQKNYQNK